jgi:prepilin-type N-terminal cleavage/methylation domain-containing protein
MIESGREKGSMNHQKGFTMLEGVMVFAIIAIVAAFAVPGFRKMAINGNLKAAAKDIMSDFASVRERAISENLNYSIVFDQDNNRYTVPGLANPKSPAHLASDIRITGVSFGTSPLVFQTRGTTSPPGDKTISLTNGRGSTATITIGTAGRIYVQYSLQ